ncbi:C13 family peptidase [Mycobacterium sp. KBS0706]|uniref:C13 family peptidase n=1 Tax=Mycobacterium sp. KBS0706 TaxID=2578109 RepID=UPI00163D8E6C|nr:C13 family peptidase [Mycobacterium sp. KBS0706]
MTTLRLAALAVATLLAACAGPAVPSPSVVAAADTPLRWKALLVAADDAEPVFDNGVDALRRSLLSFGVAPADIAVLKADARQADAIATKANFDRAMTGLAGPAGTGCFVYLTSHGVEGRGLFAAADDAVIPPAYLAQALDGACAGRPTVLVTSGCYSGIYTDTPALTTPDRIVLTAARADRPSFGCGRGDRYTYYDQCFLDSLKRGAAWTAIAADISGCVARRERTKHFQPSQPQSAFGRDVAGLTAF